VSSILSLISSSLRNFVIDDFVDISGSPLVGPRLLLIFFSQH
jgi:hypothetical protein